MVPSGPLWQNRDNPRRSARTTLNFHGQRDQGSSFDRQSLKVCHIFQRINISSIENLMRDKNFRSAIIYTRGVDPDAVDLPFPGEKFSGFMGNSGKMQITDISRAVGPEVLFLIGPELSPPAVNEHDRALRNLPVGLFPTKDIIGRQSIIRIFSTEF